MPVFKTPFNGYSVKFSRFYEFRLVVATASTSLTSIPPPVLPSPSSSPSTPPTASTTSPGPSLTTLLVAAVADVSVKLYDLALPPTSNTLRSLHEYTREVSSADYNPTRRDSFLTASWVSSIRTFKEHAYCVYSAVWNPRHADVFASASGDCIVHVWDVREPGFPMIISAHDFDILSCDWNKYDDCVIATPSVDKSIKIWDVRSIRAPISGFFCQQLKKKIVRVGFDLLNTELKGK